MTLKTRPNEIDGCPVVAVGDIHKALGINISAKFIEEKLGVKPAEQWHNTTLFFEADFEIIMLKLSKHCIDLSIESLNEVV